MGGEVTPDRWRRIEDLYHAVRKCRPNERQALLESTDPDIRARVELMLEVESGDQILDQPAVGILTESMRVPVTPGARLGPYEIEAQIGSGGMGEVFRARDTRLGRSVALKAAKAQFSGRFEREARAISALNHPHICTLYDVGPDYLVMELVDGETLSSRLERGKLPLEETLRYGAQICEALAEAHAHGIVHRDLKPSNIMLTRHGAKVLDFGLAKRLDESGITQSGVLMGTPAYMAPEQVAGREPTPATDLFSFGLVLYEMAAGKRPFPGVALGQALCAGHDADCPPLPRQLTSGGPELDMLVGKLLAKDPNRRPQSAADAARELSALAERISTPPARVRSRALMAVGAAVVVLALAAGGLLFRRIEQRRWAREGAIPQITRLAEQQPLAAFMLLRQAEAILPGDRQLAEVAQSTTRLVSVDSAPAGAKVEIQDYLKPSGWFTLGTTPLSRVRVPSGYFRWRVSKPGQRDLIAAPATESSMKFLLAGTDTPPGMVPLDGGPWGEYIDFVGPVVYNLPAFDMDKFEVTNAQYQRFVDQGGYRKPEYWKEKFIKDGKELTWQQAMDLFRDPTGRPGPATWEAGHFPQGQADYPVSGVSWYEAAAYAVFAGRSLPTIGQWYKAAPSDLAPFAVNASNFGKKGPAAVGTYAGVGPYGTYDMAGNVREWTGTGIGTEDRRFILGGAWGTQTYQAFDPETLPPFDRSPMNGIRTVRNRASLPAEAIAPLKRQVRDFSKARPASDEVFQAYRAAYAYDRRPLNAKSDGIVEGTPAWMKEKIVIDAGYEGQRLPMYLFLPKNVHPPYETILFFPSARVEFMNDSGALGDMEFVDYAIKSGRALLYPIYNGTYERRKGGSFLVGTIDDFQMTIQRSKEVRRALDYLVSRPDIDASRVAYLGVSMGTAYGVIFATLEDRFRAVIFLDGGFFLGPAAPGRDQVDFAPRLKKPVLMANGKYDFTFSPARSQEPMFRMLGTAPADKRRVVFDTPHDVSQDRAHLSAEVLGWLDKYLGRVY